MMKKKVKKIRLSKETLRSLGGQSLGVVTGGQETVTLCNRESNCVTCYICGGDTRTCPP
jgi:hypothetical protein